MNDSNVRTAFITGASSGLGKAFAQRLADQGYSLVLVARRKDVLDDLSYKLRQRFSISTETIKADLSESDGIELVQNRIAEFTSLDILINNAGFGTAGKFAEIEIEKHLDMVHVHVIAAFRFCRAALPGMIAQRKGNIINVSSLAAFMPLSGRVTYCATKATLVTYSQALATELRRTGIRIQALCPGFTYTGFHDTPELEGFNRSDIPRIMWSTAEEVVSASLKALDHNKVICVPGVANQFLAAFARNNLTFPLLRALLKKMV